MNNFRSLTFLWRRPKVSAVCLHLTKILVRLFPIRRNRVMLISRNGYYWSCNPRALALAMAASGEWDVNVGLQAEPSHFGMDKPIKGVRFLRIGCFLYYCRLFTARYFITNEVVGQSDSYPFKRKGQTFIYTTHGGAGIKRAYYADEEGVLPHWSYNNQCQDLILSNSLWKDRICREQYHFKQPILRTGLPRNDVFSRPMSENIAVRKKVISDLGITDSPDLHLLVYAPTFRFKDTATKALYDIDLKRVLRTFELRFGGHWVVAVHKHPYMADRFHTMYDYSDPCIIDGLKVMDIQDLILCADALITDYSSVNMDFCLTGRPQFQFFVDGANWRTLCMMDPKELPFPYAENNDQLCAAIETFDAEEYAEKLRDFKRNTIQTSDDGHASERVIQWMKDHQ